MRLIRRIVGWGLATMGAVALAAAIWPAVAGVVTGLLVTVLCAAAAVLAVLGGRRARVGLAGRRGVRAIPVALRASTDGDVAACVAGYSASAPLTR